MVALTSKFDILRGWPNGSAVQEDFIIGASGNQSGWTHPHAAGTWVKLASTNDGTMKTVDGAASSAFDTKCYLVIEGADDYSSRFSHRVTCLLGGGYMVRVPQNYKDADGNTVVCLADAASTFTVGDQLKVVSNQLSEYVATVGFPASGEVANAVNTTEITNRSGIVATVMAVNSNDNTIDVYVH